MLLRLVGSGVLPISLLMEIAEDEEEGDEDDGLNRSDEDEIIGQMAMFLLDGKKQNSDEKDGQGQGHHDIFGEFAHGFIKNWRIIILSRICELENYYFWRNLCSKISE